MPYTVVGYRNTSKKSTSKKKPKKRTGPIGTVNKKKTTTTSKRSGPIKVSSVSSKPKAKNTSTPKYKATTKKTTSRSQWSPNKPGSTAKSTTTSRSKWGPNKTAKPSRSKWGPDKPTRSQWSPKKSVVKKPAAPKAKRSFRSGTNKPTDMAKRYVGNKNTKPRKSYFERKGLGNRLADWDWD